MLKLPWVLAFNPWTALVKLAKLAYVTSMTLFTSEDTLLRAKFLLVQKCTPQNMLITCCFHKR